MSGEKERVLCAVVFGIVTATLTSPIASAGVNRWTTNGPNAPSNPRLAISTDAKTLYLAAGLDFFKSSDSGATWQTLPNPSPGSSVGSIMIDPRLPATLYAATGGQIFRSDDGAQEWRKIFDGADQFAIDSLSPSTLYAAGGKSIFRSIDGGSSWTTLSTSQFGIQKLGGIGLLACHPKRPGTVYVTVTINEDAGAELWQSTDLGTSWSLLSIAGGQANYRYIVWSVFGDPNSENTIYAILDRGLFKTTDGGKTWTGQTSATTGSSSTLLIDPTNPSRLYFSNSGNFVNGFPNPGSGLFLSTNGGGSWNPLGEGLPQAGITSMVMDPAHASLYVGTGTGIFKSTDLGANFSGPAFIPTGSNVQAIALAPAEPNVLFAGTDHGVYGSTDGGKSWHESGLADSRIGAIVTDPQTPSRLYAMATSAIMQSLDSGRTWSPASYGLGDFPEQGIGVSALAIDPKKPSTLYAFESTSFKLYKTTDNAQHWISTSLAEWIYAITVDPLDSSVIYAGSYGDFTYGRDVLIKSRDGGKSWSESQNGLPFPGGVNAILIDPHDDLVLYAGTSRFGVFKSTDGAANWSATESAKSLGYVTSLAIDPLNSANVYAVTGNGVYRSADYGASWTPLNNGLPNLSVTSLAIDRTGRFLFAGTAGGGVFEYEFPSGSIDLTVGNDGATRLLSIDPQAGSLSVERVTNSGSVANTGPFGPYAGWTARATAGSDSTKVLWTRDDGSIGLSLLSDTGISVTFRYPVIAGLSAIDVAAFGPSTHVLWTSADGRAQIQTIDASGSVVKTVSFGPYTGWQATAISDGPDGLTRILWNKIDGTAGVSVVSADGNLTTTRYGPAAGWTALDIAVGGDGLIRLLWLSVDGRVTLGILESSGKLFRYGEVEASPASLSPTRVAAGSDGSSRILLNGSNGASRLWIMSAAGERQREIVISSGPGFDITGDWGGPFQTKDPGDCHSDPSASVTFSQSGSEVTGRITTIANTCGFGGDFQGTLSGNRLTGILNKAGFGQASVSGTVSDTEILLTVANMFSGNREIPGGTLDLHR